MSTILILTNDSSGLYQFRKELIERLSTSYQLVIAVPDGDFIKELKEIGCKIIKCNFNRRSVNPFSDLKLLNSYIKIIKSVKPIAVLTYTIKPNIYGGLACQFCHRPYLSNITGLGTSIENGGILSFISKTLYKIGLKKSSCVFFQNSHNQNFFIKNKLIKSNSRLLPGSGVNLDFHKFELYPANDNNIKFLFIGRLMLDKGLNELLKAIEVLHENYSNISLDILGTAESDYNMELLNNLCKKGFVKYHGEQRLVHPFISVSHCTVLPSYHEGMANVLLESSATGRPVIATDIPGCKETFDENITGFSCKVKDPSSLIHAMEKFINLPYEEKKLMGFNARKKVENEYSRNIVIEAYLEEINKLNKAD